MQLARDENLQSQVTATFESDIKAAKAPAIFSPEGN